MVDRAGLENRCTGNRTVGSNPTPSARTPASRASSSCPDRFGGSARLDQVADSAAMRAAIEEAERIAGAAAA